MSDRALVAALVSGDPDGLAGAYRAYADRLYTYCHSLTADGEAAAQALHDTFVLASQCAHRLQDPDRLRFWLYAIARNECLRLARQRHRGHDDQEPPLPASDSVEQDRAEQAGLEQAGGEQPGDPATGTAVEPDLDPDLDPQLDLMPVAAEALTEGEREAFELSSRHGVPTQEIAALLGCSATQARDRVAKARSELERALAALWAARSVPNPCPGLVQLIGGVDTAITPRSRKAVARHVRDCPICTEDTQRQPHPTASLPAWVDAPFLTAPPLLWPRIELHAFDPGLAPEREAVRRRSGRFAARTGFPRQPDDRRRRRQLAFAGAVTVAGLALLAGGIVATGQTDPAGSPDAAPPASATASPPADPESSEPNGRPPLAAAQAAPPEPTSSSEPTASPDPDPTGPPPSLTVEAGADVDCVVGGLFGFRLEVTAEASQSLQDAELFVTTDSGSESFPLDVDGAVASGETEVLFGDEVEWRVAVTDTGGEAAATAAAQISEPCS